MRLLNSRKPEFFGVQLSPTIEDCHEKKGVTKGLSVSV